MLNIPLAGASINAVHLFTAGICVGILCRCYGLAANIIMVPLLYLFGLPVAHAAGINITQSFGRSLVAMSGEGMHNGGLRRVGLVTGLAGLPGVAAGRSFYLFLSGQGVTITAVHLTYIVLSLLVAGSIIRHWYSFARQGYFEDNPLPPFGLKWRYPLAVPGAAGLKFITLGRVTAVGLILGFATGYIGLGAAVTAIPLFMYVLGLSAAVAAATSILPVLIIDSAGMVGYALDGKLELVPVMVVLVAVFIGDKIGLSIPPEVKWNHTRLVFASLLLITAASIPASIWWTGKIAGMVIVAACLALIGITAIMSVISFINEHRTDIVKGKAVN
ncbi:MAG: hypothetical protein VR69_17060 [Peptococcaceae bacterium BRH_c4b]|nr:MAG: hypothetical protein VR69_17060 [Peptococcaceae bacterium BRH_c4b]